MENEPKSFVQVTATATDLPEINMLAVAITALMHIPSKTMRMSAANYVLTYVSEHGDLSSEGK